MVTIIGLDWDNIDLNEALRRRTIVENQEKTSTLLFRTLHGFHLYILFKKDVSVDQNFSVREKYWDCKNRLNYSKSRFMTTNRKDDIDILFTMKNGFFEELIP